MIYIFFDKKPSAASANKFAGSVSLTNTRNY